MPRMCCVPFCGSNYRSRGGPTITTFSFPKNEEQKQLWLECIPRKNFVPGTAAAVCIKHFKEQFIIREVSATRDDGTLLVIPRDRPKLSADAYPSIFEQTAKIPSRKRRGGRKTIGKNEEEEKELSTAAKPDDSKEEVACTLPCERVNETEKGTEEMKPDVMPRVTRAEICTRGVKANLKQPRKVGELEVIIEEGVLSQGASCFHCKASFASQSALQNHIATCQPSPASNRRNLKSRKQGAATFSNSNSQKAFRTNVKTENHEDSSKEILTSDGVKMFKTVIHTGQTLYTCEQCPALFTSYFHLEDHKKVHPGSQPLFVDPNSETSDPPSFAAFGRKPKKASKEEKSYSCPVCQEKFKSFVDLRVHKRMHAGTKTHCCDVCGKCFQRASKLKVHNRVHTNERPYSCEICNARFTQLGNLNIHKRTHSGERPFKCDVCKAAFMQPTHLKVHQRCHTGERPYGCTLCNAAFSQMTSLVIHKRTHTGERPFPCDMCDLAFNSRGDLKVHKRRHTGERPYTCDLCQASFKHLGTLNVHKRRHAGKRPFLCEACGVAFITLSELKTHKRRHTGEQPYRCEICGSGFTQLGSLNAHKRRHQEESSAVVECIVDSRRSKILADSMVGKECGFYSQ